MRKVTLIPGMGIGKGMITMEEWDQHAREALSKVYKPDEVELVCDWFMNIRGSAERELMGSRRVDAHLDMVTREGHDPIGGFSVYASLMSRMWIYAPYIIQEAIRNGELK